MRRRRRRSRITIVMIYSGDQRLLSTHELIHLHIDYITREICISVSLRITIATIYSGDLRLLSTHKLIH